MQPEVQPSRLRAAASNNPRSLAGVDGRSAAARRFRDLVNDITTSIGGDFDALPAAKRGQVRQAAALVMQSEQLQGAIVRGETVDSDELVRLSSETRRVFAALKDDSQPIEFDDILNSLGQSPGTKRNAA